MTNETCKKCGFEIEPDDLIVVYGMPKHRDCFGVMVDRLEAAERRVAELEAEIQKWRKFVGLDHPSWDAIFTPDNDWVRYLTTKSIHTESHEIITDSGSRKEE